MKRVFVYFSLFSMWMFQYTICYSHGVFHEMSVSENDIVVFLDWNLNDSIQIFDCEGINNGYLYCQNRGSDDVTMLRILGGNDSMYYVLAYSGLTDTLVGLGWINHSAPLRLTTKIYMPEDTLVLYTSPTPESDRSYSLQLSNLTESGLVNVVAVNQEKGWIKISVHKEDMQIEGWVPYHLLCPNPFTTCG